MIEGVCEKETLIYSFLLFYLNIELNINKKFSPFLQIHKDMYIEISKKIEIEKNIQSSLFASTRQLKKGIKGK